MSSVFRTSGTAFCSRSECWRSTAWAVTFPLRVSTRCGSRSSSVQNAGSFLGFIDLFSGGTFRRLTIFALGIMPYITASIILQLLTVVVPTLEKLQKEGELGRRKITQWTRYLTVGLALMQSLGIATMLQASEGSFVLNPGIRLHPDDHAQSDDRHGVHHVAGRADYRARNRQRHVADHLRRYRGRPAERDQ